MCLYCLFWHYILVIIEIVHYFLVTSHIFYVQRYTDCHVFDLCLISRLLCLAAGFSLNLVTHDSLILCFHIYARSAVLYLFLILINTFHVTPTYLILPYLGINYNCVSKPIRHVFENSLIYMHTILM